MPLKRTLKLRKSLLALAPAREYVRRFCERCGCDDETVRDIVIAAGEALTNAVQHGGAAGGSVTVRLDRHDDAVEIVITDENGAQPTTSAVKGRAGTGELRSGGYGLTIIEALMDHVHFAVTPGTGAIIKMRKYC
jgi:anti-sigma regulatory factor (Ser/Thr protein kinase)